MTAHTYCTILYTAISIKVVHEQSGKVEYERERLLGIANKLMNFQSGSQQPFALVFDFSALLVDNLNSNSRMQMNDYIGYVIMKFPEHSKGFIRNEVQQQVY